MKTIDFIKNMPKVELHMHVEGSMEPELMWQLAERNQFDLPYKNLSEIKQAYQFRNLAEFIEVFIQGTKVVQSEQDLYDICMAYFKVCEKQNIRHTEVHCDIRTYVDFGYPAEMVIDSLDAAFADAKRLYGMTGGFMPCFLRHLGPEKAQQDLELLLPFKDKITAIGLSAVEIGFPPSLFKDTFKKVHEAGIKVIAHAGEEAGPEYIWSAINDINVDRIDHGIQCLKDEKLVDYLVEHQIPLTVCPSSNIALNIFDTLDQHPLPQMLKKGLNVSIHSDDPAHFDAYLNENIIGIYKNTTISKQDIIKMAQNSIQSSFASKQRKEALKLELDEFVSLNGSSA